MSSLFGMSWMQRGSNIINPLLHIKIYLHQILNLPHLIQFQLSVKLNIHFWASIEGTKWGQLFISFLLVKYLENQILLCLYLMYRTRWSISILYTLSGWDDNNNICMKKIVVGIRSVHRDISFKTNNLTIIKFLLRKKWILAQNSTFNFEGVWG